MAGSHGKGRGWGGSTCAVSRHVLCHWLCFLFTCSAIVGEHTGPWSKRFDPPVFLPKVDSHFTLTPMTVELNHLDYAAVMANRQHLLQTLGWSYDFDHLKYENWRDLLAHQQAFKERRGYAYAILEHRNNRDLRELGAAFVGPLDVGAARRNERAVLTFWIAKDRLRSGLQRDVLRTLVQWLTNAWPFEIVHLPVLESNRALIELCVTAGLQNDTLDSGRDTAHAPHGATRTFNAVAPRTTSLHGHARDEL